MDNAKGMKILTGASLALAILQNLCAAVLTISGIRLAIGLTAFVLAGTAFYTPVRWFHQDAIRIPMLVLATVGAIADIAVLAWIRHLRSRPAAQWRRREKSTKEKRSERLQIALAILTLALVGLETGMHMALHPSHRHDAVQTNAVRRT